MKTDKSTVLPATSYSAILGRVLRSMRDERGVDQATLAAALGITQGAMSRLEHGTSVISADQLHVAAAALGFSPAELVRRADDAEKTLKTRGVQVVTKRGANDGLAMITGAALAALLTAVILKK